MMDKTSSRGKVRSVTLSSSEVRDDEDDDRNWQHHVEQSLPRELVDDPPGQAWADSRCERDDQTKGTHCRTAFMQGEDGKKNGLH